MLTESDILRFQKIENQLALLQSEVKIQQIVISGLLSRLFADDVSHHSAFFAVLHDELSKLPPESDTRHYHIQEIQQWIDRYRN